MVELQNKKELFSQFPGNVYAVSASSVDEHKAMKEELGLEYPVISDKNLKLIRKVELLDPEAPISVRGFAVLDKDGKVLHSQQIDTFGLEAEGIIPYAADIANGKQPSQ
ncbi:redoxin domain-containing protein [Mesobacillus subterraneus]|uniref:Redoxin domain-containing protein n=1 Tax=Mesobacillus subterraneus TaxID=285983 RepID=A0A3R9FLA4_9BACI|nr:redoxin domain-containing protein [Mesobacillus subterraneus]RSD29042.1 redoxin domain-containing protein [Mesobacillus subterraneus]